MSVLSSVGCVLILGIQRGRCSTCAGFQNFLLPGPKPGVRPRAQKCRSGPENRTVPIPSDRSMALRLMNDSVRRNRHCAILGPRWAFLSAGPDPGFWTRARKSLQENPGDTMHSHTTTLYFPLPTSHLPPPTFYFALRTFYFYYYGKSIAILASRRWWNTARVRWPPRNRRCRGRRRKFENPGPQIPISPYGEPPHPTPHHPTFSEFNSPSTAAFRLCFQFGPRQSALLSHLL